MWEQRDRPRITSTRYSELKLTEDQRRAQIVPNSAIGQAIDTTRPISEDLKKSCGGALPQNAVLVADEFEVRQGIRSIAGPLRTLAMDTLARQRKPLVMIVIAEGGLDSAIVLGQEIGYPIERHQISASTYRANAELNSEVGIKSNIPNVKNRTVLVHDDIFDTGVTFAAVVKALADAGAETIVTSVLVEKEVGSTLPRPDYCALTLTPEVSRLWIAGWGAGWTVPCADNTTIEVLRNLTFIFGAPAQSTMVLGHSR